METGLGFFSRALLPPIPAVYTSPWVGVQIPIRAMASLRVSNWEVTQAAKLTPKFQEGVFIFSLTHVGSS